MSATMAALPHNSAAEQPLDLAASAHVIIAATDDLDAIHARGQALFEEGYRLGYAAGHQIGYAHAENDMDAVWAETTRKTRALANQPTHAQLVRRRNKVSHAPCGSKCGGCSKCIHSKAWWARGGRDWLGVEAELRLSHVSRVDGAA